MSMTAAATTALPSRNTLPAEALDIQVVSLSRNFGKEAALLAGLDHARFGAVLFMDGDGQHPPALIPTLVGHWLDGGNDVVFTAKAHRANESALRRFGVRMFYWLLNWKTKAPIPEDAGDFRLLSPRAADALRRLPERNRFFKGLASWIGFKQFRVDYEPAERAHGTTSWSPVHPHRPVDRRPDVVLGGAIAARQPARPAAGAWSRCCSALRSCGRRVRGQIGAGLSVARGRAHGAGRRAAHHDRHHGRIHRQGAVGDQSPAGLFRRRAQRADRAGPRRYASARRARTAAE